MTSPCSKESEHMESLELIKVKWDFGVYDLDYMMQLVQKKEISKQDFHQITRYNYNGCLKTRKK